METMQHQMMGYDRTSTMFSPDGSQAKIKLDHINYKLNMLKKQSNKEAQQSGLYARMEFYWLQTKE